MIQRIQSIFLLLAALCLGLLFIDSFDFAKANNIAGSDPILGDGDYDTNDHPLLMGLVIAGMIISLITIFLFKNRNLQSNITKLAMVIIIGLVAAAGYYFAQNESLAESLNGSLELSFGWASPTLALIFAVFALRGINKDENLVKSMDRLR